MYKDPYIHTDTNPQDVRRNVNSYILRGYGSVPRVPSLFGSLICIIFVCKMEMLSKRGQTSRHHFEAASLLLENHLDHV